LGCGDVAGARDALERVDDVLRRTVLPPDRTNVFAWDAYVGAALIRGGLGDGDWPASELETLVGRWERDGILEAVAEGHLALARLAAHTGNHRRAGLAAQAALVEAEAAGLPGTAWRAHALLSTLPGGDPGHAVAARSIVKGLTSSLSDHRLAGVLNDTLERELGGSP